MNTFESEFRNLLLNATYRCIEEEDANDTYCAFLELQEKFKRKHTREYLKIPKEIEEFFIIFANYKISETTLTVLEN